MNQSLIRISNFINTKIDIEKFSKTRTVELMNQQLHIEETRTKMLQQLVIAH